MKSLRAVLFLLDRESYFILNYKFAEYWLLFPVDVIALNVPCIGEVSENASWTLHFLFSANLKLLNNSWVAYLSNRRFVSSNPGLVSSNLGNVFDISESTSSTVK